MKAVGLTVDLENDNEADVVIKAERGGYKTTILIKVQVGGLELENECYKDPLIKKLEVKFDQEYFTEVYQNGNTVKIVPKRYPVLCG